MSSELSKLDNESYYDEFASWYERKRGYGYHQLLDDLEVDLVREYGMGRDVLEVGCGTGLLLSRFDEFATSCKGIDISDGMLEAARARGLDVTQGTATELPFGDEEFDVTCSFKVLPHVADIHKALAEMTRVTRVGGYVIAEFYNKHSLRYLVKRLKKPTRISYRTSDEAVYTRYDTPQDVESYFPSNAAIRRVRGIRVVTPMAKLHDLPGVGGLLRRAERRVADTHTLGRLGGFYAVVAQRVR